MVRKKVSNSQEKTHVSILTIELIGYIKNVLIISRTLNIKHAKFFAYYITLKNDGKAHKS